MVDPPPEPVIEGVHAALEVETAQRLQSVSRALRDAILLLTGVLIYTIVTAMLHVSSLGLYAFVDAILWFALGLFLILVAREIGRSDAFAGVARSFSAFEGRLVLGILPALALWMFVNSGVSVMALMNLVPLEYQGQVEFVLSYLLAGFHSLLFAYLFMALPLLLKWLSAFCRGMPERVLRRILTGSLVGILQLTIVAALLAEWLNPLSFGGWMNGMTDFDGLEVVVDCWLWLVRCATIGGFGTLILAVLFLAWMQIYIRNQWKKVRCPNCHYDLRGSGVTAGCPECGWGRHH